MDKCTENSEEKFGVETTSESQMQVVGAPEVFSTSTRYVPSKHLLREWSNVPSLVVHSCCTILHSRPGKKTRVC